MSSIWPKLEGLLDDVQKPVRYIRSEDRAITPKYHAKKWFEEIPGSPEIIVERERKGKVVVEDLRKQIISIEGKQMQEYGYRPTLELNLEHLDHQNYWRLQIRRLKHGMCAE